MNAYLDTSALIRAWRLGLAPNGITRAHSLAEFYCVLTGPGLAVVKDGKTFKLNLSPDDTVAAARETFANVQFKTVSGEDTLEALQWAAQANVCGRLIHDWLHLDVAKAVFAREIVTLNVKDFARLTHLKIVSPEEYFAATSAPSAS